MIDPEDDGLTEETVPNSAVDEGQRKRRETKKQRMAREDREFIRKVMSLEVGRRVMWSILSIAHPFETIFAAGAAGVPDPYATFHHNGEQQLGLRLFQSWFMQAPEETMLMLRENDPRFTQLAAD